MNYIFLYSSTLFVSFTLTLVFYLYHSKYWEHSTHMPLKMIYILNMTSAVLCIVWAIVDGRPEYSYINYIGNIIEFNCMGYCGYFWLKYCLQFVDIPALKKKSVQTIILLPILIVTVLIVTTPIHHGAFYIDDGGFFRRGSFYFIQQTGYLYILLSSIVCIYYIKKCHTSSEKRHLLVLSMFPVSPAIFGGAQILLPSGMAPTLQFSILVSLILVFVDELDQKINDNYGHQQGDVALTIVGNVFTKLSSKYKTDTARVGGDEFVTVMETLSMQKTYDFKKDLDEMLEEACRLLPYKIHLSTGIIKYDSSKSLLEIINQSDAEMYAQKKLYKQQNIQI